MRGNKGVAGEWKVVGVPKFHSWGIVFSLKYRTAKNNSKWECLENFRELLIIELKCPVRIREFYSTFFVS